MKTDHQQLMGLQDDIDPMLDLSKQRAIGNGQGTTMNRGRNITSVVVATVTRRPALMGIANVMIVADMTDMRTTVMKIVTRTIPWLAKDVMIIREDSILVAAGTTVMNIPIIETID